MKNKLLTLAGALALLAVLGKFYAGPAIAQTVRAVLVKNEDEKGRNPYSQFLTCNSSGECTATGSVVPANTRVVIQHVSGNFESTGQSLAFVALSANNSGLTSFLPATLVNVPAHGFNNFYVNQPVLLYVEAGDMPKINLQGTSTDPVFCFVYLTGYTVNLNQ